MERLQQYAMPLGRVLLAFIFVLSGLMKLGDIPGNMAYIESGGLPGVLIWPTILLEVAGGMAVALGWQTRLAALLLAGFTLLTGLLYHLIPAGSAEGMMAQMQMIMFLKNLSITGGLLILFATGGGAYALDARHGGAAPA
ncbi:putative oxidoreductase [Meinhardsimonia xiamenensis]|jgi:putative oxidoreductase|uniref:Putative oxidoreductase n=1 Tax=Meinhardsimonia xiamenensis TaxID=990712 RepID=A0A1G9F353_9RHOB|nr:DoxX family protein [Meinhardsimonia xiamenensis]PRX38016.1 putative oxidoreductase [Meinhardsimonia xiamenensis]SDK82824.1 putative oxidoreductase [Meinhardsimonia xiamenensis]